MHRGYGRMRRRPGAGSTGQGHGGGGMVPGTGTAVVTTRQPPPREGASPPMGHDHGGGARIPGNQAEALRRHLGRIERRISELEPSEV